MKQPVRDLDTCLYASILTYTKGVGMHEIAVDDQVMDRLKERAEPFVDTPNDVLRRLLVGRPTPERPTATPEGEGRSDRPGASAFGVPRALEQILAVARRVRFGGLSRIDATHEVADANGVAFQTVLDKYTRQLGLEAAEFDSLLNQPALGDLTGLLLQRFPDQGQLIEETLSGDSGSADKTVLATWVLDSLGSRGGEAHHIQIAKDIWDGHEDELRAAGELFYTWQYDLRWAGQRLRDAGTLLPDSQTRRGHWRLAPSGPYGAATESFRKELVEVLREAEGEGLSLIQVRAGDLHKRVGGYPGRNHRMPSCCSAMRSVIQEGDHIVTAPPKGDGASLTIEFLLPRRKQNSAL